MVGMKGWVVAARGDGTGDQPFSLLAAPRLVGDEAQQMQAVGIVRFALQDLAQKGFRRGGVSPLKVGQRLFQEYRDGYRWRAGGPLRLVLALLLIALQSLASMPGAKGIVSPAVYF